MKFIKFIYYTGKIGLPEDHLGIYLQPHIQHITTALQNTIATTGVSSVISASKEVELNILL